MIVLVQVLVHGHVPEIFPWQVEVSHHFQTVSYCHPILSPCYPCSSLNPRVSLLETLEASGRRNPCQSSEKGHVAGKLQLEVS